MSGWHNRTSATHGFRDDSPISQVRVKRIHAGDHFGYDALLSDTYETTITCLSDVELTVVRSIVSSPGALSYSDCTVGFRSTLATVTFPCSVHFFPTLFGLFTP